MSKIFFYGELPPKVVHGISISNYRILSYLKNEHTISVVDDNSSFCNFFVKLMSLLKGYVMVLFAALKDNDVFYVNAPMSTFGLLKVRIFVGSAKLISRDLKVVAHLHRGDVIEFISSPVNRKQFTRFCDTLHTLVVLSAKSREELIEESVISPSKIAVIHNTIIPLLNQNDPYNSKSFEGEFYCLCNYIDTKRIHNLVEISQQLNLQFGFNGTPSSISYVDKLRSIDKLGLCKFNGPIFGEEKEVKLRDSKVLVLPSLNEGMPLVILESIAQGTPVICFNVGYISDYLGVDYPGLVNNLTDAGLAEKINWFDNISESEYLALRKHSFDIFWKKFSPENINKDIDKVF